MLTHHMLTHHVLTHHGPQAWRCIHGDATQQSAWEAAAALSGERQQRQEQQRQEQQRQQQQQRHCFVLLMEVLDNLPHDRVMRADVTQPWQQVAVQLPRSQLGRSRASSAEQQQQYPCTQQQQQQELQSWLQQNGSFAEVLQPATDPLVLRCLASLYPAASASSDGSSGIKPWLQGLLGLPATSGAPALDVWLPTRCLALLDALHAALPRHTLLAADFDALPDVTVPGRCAPLVSGRPAPGITADQGTVLVPWGSADIFFPTDFDGLASLYRESAARSAADSRSDTDPASGSAADAESDADSDTDSVSTSHSATGSFMAAFAEARATRLLSGYNPLVSDWSNTRVFVGQCLHGIGGSGSGGTNSSGGASTSMPPAGLP
jgi:flagellar motility protein MotE (MotC chaperone)